MSDALLIHPASPADIGALRDLQRSAMGSLGAGYYTPAEVAAAVRYVCMPDRGLIDDGTYVKREFEAPKTQVMGIVINGVLKGELNWSMIAIGAMIALMLELAGVSALAFAVGVYVPIQY